MQAMAPSLQPHVTSDSFFHTTSPPRPVSSNSPATPVIVYFISGNPGLISYYYPFFTYLSAKLQSLSSKQKKDHQFHIYGHSLAGFEVQSPLPTHYHNVEDQIRFIQRKLDSFVQATTQPSPTTNVRPRVILMGHSVGTYIAMEVIRRHRERSTSDHSNTGGFDIIGGVMLFPTVMDIASSPSGKKLTTLLSIIPPLALVVSVFARILTTLLPDFALRTLIKLFMADPPSQAIDTTCAFLKSKRGVRQALHMAADEMRIITTDKWSDDVWGIASSSSSSSRNRDGERNDSLTTAASLPARMFFYFGRNDHWVAEKTREEIIEAKSMARVKGGKTPTMVVCEDGLPHAFCLRHSEVTASKAAGMVMDIIAD